VILDKGPPEYSRISGKLLEFERRSSSRGNTVHVALELRLDRPGVELPLLLKQYQTSENISSNDMTQVVEGFNIAVDRVYREFLEDLAAALHAP
jgi:hypothetical protein